MVQGRAFPATCLVSHIFVGEVYREMEQDGVSAALLLLWRYCCFGSVWRSTIGPCWNATSSVRSQGATWGKDLSFWAVHFREAPFMWNH